MLPDDEKKKSGEEISDEMFERIAAEKRRKLDEFLQRLEAQEQGVKIDGDKRQTIHRDLFPGGRPPVQKPESPAPKPVKPEPAEAEGQMSFEALSETEEEIKIYNPRDKTSHVQQRSATRDEAPPAATEIPYVQPHEDSDVKIAADAPANDVPENDAPANDVPENDAPADDVPADDDPAQEQFIISRQEKMSSFVLKTGDDEAEKEDNPEEPDADVEDGDYEYTEKSDPDEIKSDMTMWRRKKVMRIWVCAVCLVASLLLVAIPIFPQGFLPYSLAGSSENTGGTAAGETVLTADSEAETSLEYTDETLSAVDEVSETTTAPVPSQTVSSAPLTVNPDKSQVRVIIGVLILINIIVFIFSFDVITGGITDFFRLSATCDSAAALVWIASTMQGIMLFVNPSADNFTAGVFGVYMPFAAFAALVAHISGWLRQVREQNGFEVISAPEPALHLRVQNEKNSAVLQRPDDGDEAAAAVFVKGDFSSHYFEMSDLEDGADRMNRILVPATLVLGIVFGFIALAIFRGAQYFITVCSAIVCSVMPMASALVCLLPQARASAVNKNHSVAISCQYAVDDACSMTAVTLDDSELFEAKNMVLKGIKPYGSTTMDEALIVAASVAEKCGGPLRALFSGILSENDGYLLTADNETTYRPENGIVCWIGGKRVVLGTRAFMAEYDITIPREESEKAIKRGRELVYLARGGELMAILLIIYKASPETMKTVRSLAMQRMRLLVTTHDPCLTSSVIASCFGLPTEYVDVVGEAGEELLEKITTPRPTLKTGVVCRGGFEQKARAILSCFRIRRLITAGFALQSGMLLLALVADVVMIFGRDLSGLTLFTLLGLQAVMVLLCAAVQLCFGFKRLGK